MEAAKGGEPIKFRTSAQAFYGRRRGGRRGMDGASLRREKKGAEKNVPEMIKTALWDKAERGGKEERSWIDALFLQKRGEKVT